MVVLIVEPLVQVEPQTQVLHLLPRRVVLAVETQVVVAHTIMVPVTVLMVDPSILT